jgi:hypothetical protein
VTEGTFFMRCGEKVRAFTLSAWSYHGSRSQWRCIRRRADHHPGATFREDWLVTRYLYHSIYGTIGDTVVPAVIVGKIFKAATPIGEADFPGPPTTIRRPFLSVSIRQSTTLSLPSTFPFRMKLISPLSVRGGVFFPDRVCTPASVTNPARS